MQIQPDGFRATIEGVAQVQVFLCPTGYFLQLENHDHGAMQEIRVILTPDQVASLARSIAAAKNAKATNDSGLASLPMKGGV